MTPINIPPIYLFRRDVTFLIQFLNTYNKTNNS